MWGDKYSTIIPLHMMCHPWILFCRSLALMLTFLTVWEVLFISAMNILQLAWWPTLTQSGHDVMLTGSSLVYESQDLAMFCTDRTILASYVHGTPTSLYLRELGYRFAMQCIGLHSASALWDIGYWCLCHLYQEVVGGLIRWSGRGPRPQKPKWSRIQQKRYHKRTGMTMK